MSESLGYYCAFWFAYGVKRDVAHADRFAQWYEANHARDEHIGIEKAYEQYTN
jgi:hypothetical protein